MSGAARDGAGDGAFDRRRTARLILRRIASGDLDAVAALHVDPANYTHLPDGPHPPGEARALAERFVENWARDGIGYWLCEADGELVGIAGISPTVLAGRTCWNLYYRFVAAARGRGLAGEAIGEAMTAAGALVPARPVIVRTRPTNGPARRLAERAGLERRPDLDVDDGFVVFAPPGF